MSGLRKALLLGSLAMLAPMALPLLGGSGSEARADAYVSGQVVIGGPIAVLGFSYGNPFAFGHVHSHPVFCDHGPLYYYPAHHVYSHYVPRYRYTYYERPRYYGHHRSYASHHRHYDGCGHRYGRAFVRDHYRGRGHDARGHSRYRGHRGPRIRGHHYDD